MNRQDCWGDREEASVAVKVREEGPGPSGGMGWREVRRFRTAQLLLIYVERMAEDSPRWPWIPGFVS